MGKIIITGANGFLGKNLINHLSDFGIRSAALLDIHSTEIESDQHINLIQHKIDLASDSGALNDLVEEGDKVIHLAWKSNPAVTGADIEAEKQLNWEASKNVIDVCTNKNAKMIFISSGGTVYGEPEYLPIDEEHPTNPISAYGIIKLKVEQAIREASVQNGLQFVILRPSNLYGQGFSLKKGLGVIGHWVDMIKNNQPIKMVGEGVLTRDFIHVDDLCKGILNCINLNNETLNLGTGKGISLKELSVIFEKLIDRPLDIIHLEDRNFDVDTNILSVKKVQKLTGWKPLVSIEVGIDQLLGN
ncbi:NAD-dependent epimerase/dehydratase family protein [Ekhidna sp.]|uniref:NAD-dependent epimerase/dehydratase family protein n=1 Tax=Ekhidna sp. TaxID=2608089 RepID=UPI0032ECEE21